MYDIIIIGTGSGGGTIAKKLAPSGRRILIIERGDFIPREKDNWDMVKVVTKGKYRTKEQWVDKNDEPFEPYTHYVVGGNSKMYGAASFRLRDNDFNEVEHYGGVSPAWPLTAKDFEPYYDEAEQLFSVHGVRGLDPFEPKGIKSLPHPPIPVEPFTEELYNNIRKLGIRAYPIPMAVKLGQDRPYPEAPTVLENFDGFPDPSEAKVDAHTSGVRKALEYDNVTLMTNTKAVKLLTDRTGNAVTSVVVEIDGKAEIIPTKLVVLAAGAINSAALLLASGNELHPNGLANSSNLVGRNYMSHINGCQIAFTPHKLNTSLFQKYFCIGDYYYASDLHAWPLGEIQLMGKNDPDTYLGLGQDYFPGKDADYISKHSIDFWLTSEDLPHPDNRVVLQPDGTIKLIYHREENNVEAYENLKVKLHNIFKELGRLDPDLREVYWGGYDLGISGVSHQCGTLRFGRNPQDSVLDINCKAHDLNNLFVADASFFPASGAYNPSLTTAANALRVGEFINKNFQEIISIQGKTAVV